MGREFVIGDIHGAFLALKKVLELASFDYQKDTLFSLGDLVDGWPQSRECIDELLRIEKLRLIQGNHDHIALDWMRTQSISAEWISQGGGATIESYHEEPVPQSHVDLLQNAEKFIIDKNRLFVHGGIDPNKSFSKQEPQTFLWDRKLYSEAWRRRKAGRDSNITGFDEVFIGHTPIHREGYLEPQKICEVWMMDTGAGWNGVLSLMDLKSYQVYYSDPVASLYPSYKGRHQS